MPSHRKLRGNFPAEAGLLLVLMGCVPVFGQMGLGMAPMRVKMHLAPGKEHTGSLMLYNDSHTDLRVRTILSDFYIDNNVTPQFGVFPKEAADSCRTWLTINPMETEIGGGGQVVVRYTIKVPENATEGDYHCAANITTLPTAAALVGTGMRIAVSVAPAFYVTIGDPRLDASIKNLTLVPPDSKLKTGWRAMLTLENSGLKHTRPIGELTVVDPQGKVVQKVKVPTVPLLPNREQVYPMALKTDLSKENYTVRVKVDLGMPVIQDAVVTVSGGSKTH